MKNKSSVFYLFFIVVVASTSCKQSDYKKSPNELEYRVIVDNKQPKAKIGEVIKYNVYWRTEKDSLFLSTRDKNIPLYSQVDSPKFKGDPLEVLAMMGAGDSISCRVPADMIFRGSPPAFLKHGDYMKLDIKVEQVLTKADYEQLMASQTTTQLQMEEKEIENYMTQKGLKGVKTPSGIYVVTEVEGTGKQPVKGNTVKVAYTGMLMNGNIFDSSILNNREPYEFQIGAHSVIEGWDIGLTYFKAGGKGKLLIPSSLGYGEQGNGEMIPPNSILVFDIQLVEVK